MARGAYPRGVTGFDILSKIYNGSVMFPACDMVSLLSVHVPEPGLS